MRTFCNWWSFVSNHMRLKIFSYFCLFWEFYLHITSEASFVFMSFTFLDHVCPFKLLPLSVIVRPDFWLLYFWIKCQISYLNICFLRRFISTIILPATILNSTEWDCSVVPFYFHCTVLLYTSRSCQYMWMEPYF